MLDALKKKLSETLDVKLFECMSSFLCWEITFKLQMIKMSQTRYAQELLDHHGMRHCKVTLTQMARDADLIPFLQREQLLKMADHTKYPRMVGELVYLSVCTRPDISFAVSSGARSFHAPKKRQFLMANRIFFCLSATLRSTQKKTMRTLT